MPTPVQPLLRGSPAQRLRLASGLVLFVFAATHFLNHALGLVSLDAMIAFDVARTAVTRSTPGTLLLAAALLLHAGSALVKLAGRRTLRLPAWEWLQLGLGLAAAAPAFGAGRGSIARPPHHCFNTPSRNTAKCRCGASGGALPVLPT